LNKSSDKRYSGEDIEESVLKELSSENFSERKNIEDTNIQSVAEGVDLFGKFNKVYGKEQRIVIDVEGKKIEIDFSAVDQIFQLSEDCDDLRFLCRDRNASSFKLVNTNQLTKVDYGVPIRVLLGKKLSEEGFPLAIEIILGHK
jgi:hypothetical protein